MFDRWIRMGSNKEDDVSIKMIETRRQKLLLWESENSRLKDGGSR